MFLIHWIATLCSQLFLDFRLIRLEVKYPVG